MVAQNKLTTFGVRRAETNAGTECPHAARHASSAAHSVRQVCGQDNAPRVARNALFIGAPRRAARSSALGEVRGRSGHSPCNPGSPEGRFVVGTPLALFFDFFRRRSVCRSGGCTRTKRITAAACSRKRACTDKGAIHEKRG
jgi:hypothetical protein